MNKNRDLIGMPRQMKELRGQLAAQDKALQEAIGVASNAMGAAFYNSTPSLSAMIPLWSKVNARLEWAKQGTSNMETDRVRIIAVERTKDSYVAFYLQDGAPGFVVDQNPEMFPSDMFITALRALT